MQRLLQPYSSASGIQYACCADDPLATLTPLPVEPEEPSKMHLAINLNFEQGHEVGHGRQIHTIGSFSTIQCSCKSKSHIVTNFPMRPRALSSQY